MVRGFAVLLLFQLCGETIVRSCHWPIPGNVLGMALLLVGLIFGAVRIEWVLEAAELLLDNMALLFVPVGVGVMLYFQLIAREWLPILTAMVLSTFVVMAVTGLITQRLMRNAPDGEGADG